MSGDGHCLHVFGNTLHSSHHVQGEKIRLALLLRQRVLSVQVRSFGFFRPQCLIGLSFQFLNALGSDQSPQTSDQH